ncbi:MAG: hypothetical protein NZ455_15720 [Bacteroidia bacterium]|nr:hypothetical protein [Bacteroidia bacterium]
MRRASHQAWCVAPSARSTPTLWAYAQRNAHKDTPKKILAYAISQTYKIKDVIYLYEMTSKLLWFNYPMLIFYSDNKRCGSVELRYIYV